MKCDMCNNESNIELVFFDGEKFQTVHLCFSCFAKQVDRLIDMMNKYGNYDMSNMRDQMGDLISKSQPEYACQCGTTFSDIVKNGQVGCANCYETFESLFAQFYNENYGSSCYFGSAPLAHQGIRELYILIHEKEEKLKLLVDEEEYEDACDIRDEISNLKSRIVEMKKHA